MERHEASFGFQHHPIVTGGSLRPYNCKYLDKHLSVKKSIEYVLQTPMTYHSPLPLPWKALFYFSPEENGREPTFAKCLLCVYIVLPWTCSKMRNESFLSFTACPHTPTRGCHLVNLIHHPSHGQRFPSFL